MYLEKLINIPPVYIINPRGPDTYLLEPFDLYVVEVSQGELFFRALLASPSHYTRVWMSTFKY